MSDHDWALLLEVPLTEREVREVLDGDGVKLRNPNLQMTLRALRCRECGVSASQVDTDCDAD